MDHFFQREIVLENQHVKLVPFEAKYAEGLRKIIFDEQITRFTGAHYRNESDLQKYIVATLESRAASQAYPFIVIDQASGEVAGSTRYGNLIIGSKRLEIGWTWYGEAFRGTTVNKACKYELLRYAFEEMQFNRVQFSVDAENTRSQKAVRKLGAKQEGIFRCNYMNTDGECRDDIYYSIIHLEWAELKQMVFLEFQ
ncbi:GNAT family N-acetyltransferase [Paenibacillus paridis]|uniref:GNAT family N-acetyltransferase n=1 Tax=Paenibacillus paridis TaxID=2583376 RepID=UPI00111D2236|nr:GNAT family N-acetyltransferase [Paenibacillus paridis]